MTLGEIYTIIEHRETEKITFWYLARWMLFWIIPSLTGKAKPPSYYLDLEKITGKSEPIEEEVSNEKQIEIWKRIDKSKGREPIDYNKLLKKD